MWAKNKQHGRSHLGWAHRLRDLAFEHLDFYGYKPSLISAEFKTVVSLITSLVVLGAYLFLVVYTFIIFMSAETNQTVATEEHDEDIVLLPESFQNEQALRLGLPSFGILLFLANGPLGSYVTWANASASFRLTFQQNTICDIGKFAPRRTDPLPSVACDFTNISAGIATADVTSCPDWEASFDALQELNNTAADPCGVADGGAYPVPRIVGTFYNQEYSYITATVSANSTLLSDPAFADALFQGNLQVFINYKYLEAGNVRKGLTYMTADNVWSKRVNVLMGFTTKAEILLRARRAVVHNPGWDIPSLDKDFHDFRPSSVESYSSMTTNTTVLGFTDVGKVFLHFDDEDAVLYITPEQDVLGMLADWGGFLAILTAIGVPAAVLNEFIFRRTVKNLISREQVVFDETVRERRAHVLHHQAVLQHAKSTSAHRPEEQSNNGQLTSVMNPMSKGAASAGTCTWDEAYDNPGASGSMEEGRAAELSHGGLNLVETKTG